MSRCAAAAHRAAALVVALTALASWPAAAQRPDTVLTGRGARPDTILTGAGHGARRNPAVTRRLAGADTAAADTAGRPPLVTWADSDSVTTALLARPGYQATRYQGDTVRFDAASRALRIVGAPAAVGRGPTLVVGDTVLYNDSARVVTALGPTVVLRDPSQQGADVVAHGRVSYDVASGRGAVTNVSTSMTSGQEYYVSGLEAVFVRDTSRARRTAYYVRNGMITSCSDSVPDYYFKAGEIKYVTRHLLVARPATLYVAGVPVFWLPFLFQDVRRGRRSGFLTPRFGLSEFVRTSPSYRRHVENLGYYLDLGDYMDAQAWFDWRSSARGTSYDPGFSRTSAEFRYNWLDRFISGGLSGSYDNERNGSTNTAISWYHSQQFSQTSQLSLDVNFVTNTTVQQRNSFNPQAQLATIRSDVRYGRKLGPFTLDLGGSRSQYPGRPQVDEQYPHVSLSSQTIGLARWLAWTPSFTYDRRATLHTDQVGQVGYRYFTNAAGVADSSRINGGTRDDQIAFQTPFVFHGFQIALGFTGTSAQRNFPVTRTFVDPADTTRRLTRTYARSFTQNADWTFGFSLPTLLPTTFRVQPSITFANVAGGSYWVRSELSGARWVHQSKRASIGVSAAPTVFGLFRGFGPFSRIRHSVTPTVSFSYSPRANVNPDYLRALNQNPANFIGALPQEQVTLGLAQVFEAKYRTDSAGAPARKIRLLSVNTTPLTWDFERARQTHHTGLTTDYWSYNLASDLLPGFNFSSQYSLFQGSTLSDTAAFRPFLTNVNASFTLNGESWIVRTIGRLFGHGGAATTAGLGQRGDTLGLAPGLGGRLSSLPAAGTYRRDAQYQIPAMAGGFSSNVTFSLQRQRPPRGGTILTYNPATYCQQYAGTPATYDLCQQQALLNPQIAAPTTDPIAGGVFVRVPPTEMITATNTFALTQHWSTSWYTQYDAARRRFASNVVTLQRDLHDWRAVFSFSQSPNGNFYFTFFIANKAQPDLKFNYNKATYRQPGLR